MTARHLLSEKHFWTATLVAGFAVSALIGPGRAHADLPLQFASRPMTNVQDLAASLDLQAEFPGAVDAFLCAPTAALWSAVGLLEFAVTVPAQAAPNAQVLVHVKDWDLLWYQKLLPDSLTPGKRNLLQVDLSPDADGWQPIGHHSAWNLTALAAPVEVGIRIFSTNTCQTTLHLEQAVGRPRQDSGAPILSGVLAESDTVYCYEKFEVRFQLPDRYANPFDPAAINVTARFVATNGTAVSVDAFYARDYYRQIGTQGETILPQGAPFWCARFAPTLPGRYEYTLQAEDRFGKTSWGPAVFKALPPRKPGFVRVSKRDPRYLEFDDGSPYFPIGHNTRSPDDTRHEEQFPWMQRWPEGSAAYHRYFSDMARHNENWAEVWCASWSLGLEWSPAWRGYHGVGWYNTLNAWELDRVIESAETNNIHVNLVIHNHGKFGLKHDKEWQHNPFNVTLGGYLEKPDNYFTDPRAMRDFRKLMRYTVARWGYSTSLFAWEFWSEHNLCGTSDKFHRTPEVVEWHRLMGAAVKDIDPFDHMISTHVSGDYTEQNSNTIALGEIDLCPVDAYHNDTNPLGIVDLLRRTAEYNNAFNKPVLVTEFGGSAFAADLRHLENTLHAALWASTAIPLAGTPMFWWWILIEEEGLYPKFEAVGRFMQGEDRRDPEMRMAPVAITRNDLTQTVVRAQCLANRRQALGWLYVTDRFDKTDPRGKPACVNLRVHISSMDPGPRTVEFWDTIEGRPLSTTPVAPDPNGGVEFDVPPFARDIAFKIK